MVEVRDVRYRYPGGDGFELHVPSLTIEAGRRVACVGASGCGKTTLVNVISGVLVPERGQVKLCGLNLGSMSDAERRSLRLRSVGMVFQEFELLDYLSAMENILLPFHIGSQRAGSAQRARARELAGTLGVAGLLARRPRKLSQGERQRVSVCRALVTGPSIVIADEPTGSLDPQNAAGVIDLLIEATSRAGAALFVVTHDHAMLDRFEQVVRMDAGRRTET
ncbi:MAG: ABC transporter ATP-binding protein [Leptolyngbya sp. PLA3]|nr:MAG: ABC transporter ATP-binding protein [Cyanobacteria bacterium CYA]MCE7968161.1 ABC transporter ATP-binding protein [Leptolyngbya sp. PL-A3]